MADELKLDLNGDNFDEVLIAGPSEGSLPGAPGEESAPVVVTAEKRITNSGDEDTRRSELMNRFRDARDTRVASGVEEEWMEAERLYNQEDRTNVEGEWRSDAFVPHATREVNNAVPHMISAVLDADKLVKLDSPDEAWKDYASLEERLLAHQLTQQTEFPKKLELWAKQTALLGTGVAFVGFKRIREKILRQEMTQVTPTLTAMREREDTVVVDVRNDISPLDITDVWVDPHATPFKISRLYYYERKSIRQMRESGMPYKNFDKLPEWPVAMADFIQSKDYSKDDTVSIGSRHTAVRDLTDVAKEDQLHHLIHEWDLEKKTWAVVADDEVELLAPRPWPTIKFPFVFMWYDYAPGNRFYGRGVVAPISKSCRNANRLRRQRDDNVELALQKMFLVRMGALLNEKEEAVWRPGGFIHVRGGSLDNAIKVLEMGDVTQSAYADERIIKQDIEDVNGIGSIAAGVPDSKAKTATGTTILRNMVVLRLRGPVRHVVESMFNVFDIMLCNNYKYIPQTQLDDIFGAQAKLYSLYKKAVLDLKSPRPKVNLSIHPAGLYDNREVKDAQFINAIGVLGNLGLLPLINQKELAKKILKSVGGLDDQDAIFVQGAQTYTAQDFLVISQKAQMLASGAQVPVNPNDRHEAYVEVYRMYQRIWPQQAQLLEPNVQQHEMFLQMLSMGAAGAAMGGGSAGNMNRMPMPTGDSSAAASAGNNGAPVPANETKNGLK